MIRKGMLAGVIILFPASIPPSSRSGQRSKPASTESSTEGIQAVQSDDAQGDWDGLLQADRTGNRGTTKDDGGEETELNAIGLVVLDAVTTQSICLSCVRWILQD
jgi:hypothetical protein